MSMKKDEQKNCYHNIKERTTNDFFYSSLFYTLYYKYYYFFSYLCDQKGTAWTRAPPPLSTLISWVITNTLVFNLLRLLY